MHHQHNFIHHGTETRCHCHFRQFSYLLPVRPPHIFTFTVHLNKIIIPKYSKFGIMYFCNMRSFTNANIYVGNLITGIIHSLSRAHRVRCPRTHYRQFSLAYLFVILFRSQDHKSQTFSSFFLISHNHGLRTSITDLGFPFQASSSRSLKCITYTSISMADDSWKYRRLIRAASGEVPGRE